MSQAKTQVPAIEGWWSTEGGIPHLLGSQCSDCKSFFFPKESMYCRNPKCSSTKFDEVPLSRAEIEKYYEGCSNGAIWPLYHDAIVPPVYHRTQFECYRRVNEKFARRIAEVAPEGAQVWVHDYQLQLLPKMLRRMSAEFDSAFGAS